MSINLIARFGRERARRSLESSFAQFQADRAVVGLSRQIAKNEAAIEELLSQAVCHLGDFLEYAGIRRRVGSTGTVAVVPESRKRKLTSSGSRPVAARQASA